MKYLPDDVQRISNRVGGLVWRDDNAVHIRYIKCRKESAALTEKEKQAIVWSFLAQGCPLDIRFE